ncbi:MAG: cytochrome P450 [bacterium]|nr:cytochrome P450 [bacterium]
MIDAAPLDDPDTFVAGLPLELLAQLREEEPVHWVAHRRGGGRYVVTSYRYVREFNRDWRQFSSSQLAVSGGEGEHRGQGAITLLEFDPPDHTALRLLVNRGFTPRAIRRLEDSAHRIAGELVDKFITEGGGDAAESLAAQLPLQVTGEMLGIPVSDRNDILTWTNTAIGAFDPEMCPTMDDARAAMANFAEYGQAHIARRKAEPGDDVFSSLVHAEYEGRRLTDEELGGWWQLLVTGSTETTRNLLSSGLMLLLDHPDQAAALAADESLLDGAIDEMLRVVTPVMHHQRRVTTPMEHESGVSFEPGQIVDLWMTSANRDPEMFDHPDVFDIRRDASDHLSLGSGGPHYCLGANLAKTEARAYFSALVPHLERMERTGPESRLRTTHFNSLKHLPVVVK